MSGSLGIITLYRTNESGRSSDLFLFCAPSLFCLLPPSLNVRNKLREREGEVIMAANHASDYFRPQPERRSEIAIHNEYRRFSLLLAVRERYIMLCSLERCIPMLTFYLSTQVPHWNWNPHIRSRLCPRKINHF